MTEPASAARQARRKHWIAYFSTCIRRKIPIPPFSTSAEIHKCTIFPHGRCVYFPNSGTFENDHNFSQGQKTRGKRRKKRLISVSCFVSAKEEENEAWNERTIANNRAWVFHSWSLKMNQKIANNSEQSCINFSLRKLKNELQKSEQ